MITLNEQQKNAHDVLVDHIMSKNPQKWAWVLKGYAGTGKTTTIGQVIRTVMERTSGDLFGGKMIAVTAPTHKAVQVLKKARAFNGNVMYATIHSLLGLKEHIDPLTGKQEFKQDPLAKYSPPIEGIDVLIIDEVSMLSNELFKLIAPYVDRRLKFVMMGDPVQIPPVNESDPIPFIQAQCDKYNIGSLELTEIVRQAADNPILGYATELRKVYKTGDVQPKTHMLNANVGIDVFHSGMQDKLESLYEKYFKSPDFTMDADHAKVIAWTNATVNNANDRIRSMLYGPTAAKIVIGEKLICDKPVLRGDSVILGTNQEIEVLSFEMKTKKIEFVIPSFPENEHIEEEFRYYDCTVKYWEIDLMSGRLMERRERVHILHEDDEKRFGNLQMKLRDCALKNPVKGIKASLWKKFYSNEKQFAWIKYNYAITAHKSQGSTYDAAIVLEWDINKNRKTEERNRIKYVAATRPRRALHVVV